MSKQLRLTVVSPERTLVNQMVSSVIAPGLDGYVGVMRDHLPMIVGLKHGLLMYRDEASNRYFISIDGGFMEVHADRVSILADNAMISHEIDINEAEKALEKARAALKGEASDMTTQEAMAELERAASRLRIAKRVGE